MRADRNTALGLVVALALGAGVVGCGGGDPPARVSAAAHRANGRVVTTPDHRVVSTPDHRAPAVPDRPVAAGTGLRGPGGYLKSDGDRDADDHSHRPSKDDQQEMVLASRHGAKPAVRRTIEHLVRDYFTAAAAGDGVTGCAMLESGLASATVAAQAQASSTGATTCATALSRIFRQQHQHFEGEEPATMFVTGVHVSGPTGFVTLAFRHALETEIVVLREDGAWKLDAISDSTLP